MKLTIEFDNESQTANVAFSRDEFKNWDFVIAVLDMAKARCETEKRLRAVQAMQHAEQAARENRAVAKQILNGRS